MPCAVRAAGGSSEHRSKSLGSHRCRSLSATGCACEEFIFASGQSALDERGEVLFAGDLPSQNRYALDGVAAILDGFRGQPRRHRQVQHVARAPALATGVPPRCAGSVRFPGRRTTRRYGDHDPRIDEAGTADPDGCLGDALDRPRTIAAPDPETCTALGLAVTDSLQPGSALRPMAVRRRSSGARRRRQRGRCGKPGGPDRACHALRGPSPGSGGRMLR